MSMLRYMLRNLLHRKFLSLLTILSVTATVGFVLLLSMSKAGVEEGAETGYGPFDLVIGAAGSETQLVLNTFYHVGAPTGNISGEAWEAVSDHQAIDRAFPMTTGDYFNEFPIVGIDSAYFMTRYGGSGLVGRRPIPAYGGSRGRGSCGSNAGTSCRRHLYRRPWIGGRTA